MPGPSEPRKSGRRVRVNTLAAAVSLVVAGCAATIDSELDVIAQPATVSPGTLVSAEQAIADGRLADAKLLIERALLVDGDNVRAKLLLAELRLATGAVDSADTLFRELQEHRDVEAQALQGSGLAHFAKGDQEGGVKLLQQSVEQDSELWRAWNALGYYYDSREDWENAVAHYSAALEAQENNPIVLNNRGFSRLMQGELDGAVADLTNAVKQDPDMRMARANLRLALAWRGEYVLALAGVPKNKTARSLNNTGYVAMLRGDFASAESFLLRAVEADPSFSPIARRNLELLGYLRQVAETDTGRSNSL